MTIEELYANFCNNFKKNSKLTRDSSGAEWNINIFHYFGKVGVEYGCKVYANPNVIKKWEKEYLVDLCWRNEAIAEYCNYQGLELILESEWGTTKEEIMWDFCKLIDIKALLKVMILWIPKEEVESMLQEMSRTIKPSRIKFKEEGYLIIMFVPVPTSDKLEKYIIEGYKIDHEGRHYKLETADFVFE